MDQAVALATGGASTETLADVAVEPQPDNSAYAVPQPMPEPTAPGEVAPSEPFLAAPDQGVIYKTREAAVVGLAEKNRTIEQLRETALAQQAQVQELLRAALERQQAPQQQPVDPYKQAYDEGVEYYKTRLGLPDSEAVALASRDVSNQRRNDERAYQIAQSAIRGQWNMDYQQLVQQDPSFEYENPANELARIVIDANPNKPPSVNYQTYKRLAGTVGATATSQPPLPSPQVMQAQQQFAARREAATDGIQASFGTASAQYANYPADIHSAAKAGIARDPSRANDPAWIHENYSKVVRLYNEARGLVGTRGYK
jgi:hypothetical protein